MKKNKGFTLIEMLVALSIISVALGIGLSALASTLRSSTKATVFNKVKQNGDQVLESMTRSIRNTIDVCASGAAKELKLYTVQVTDCSSPPALDKVTRFVCTEGQTSGTLDQRNGKIEKIEEENAVITSQIPMTSNVRLKPASCIFAVSATIPKRVDIDFILTQSADLVGIESQAEVPFHTEVTLRNF